jgi:hypothetical protein
VDAPDRQQSVNRDKSTVSIVSERVWTRPRSCWGQSHSDSDNFCEHRLPRKVSLQILDALDAIHLSVSAFALDPVVYQYSASDQIEDPEAFLHRQDRLLECEIVGQGRPRSGSAQLSGLGPVDVIRWSGVHVYHFRYKLI